MIGAARMRMVHPLYFFVLFFFLQVYQSHAFVEAEPGLVSCPVNPTKLWVTYDPITQEYRTVDRDEGPEDGALAVRSCSPCGRAVAAANHYKTAYCPLPLDHCLYERNEDFVSFALKGCIQQEHDKHKYKLFPSMIWIAAIWFLVIATWLCSHPNGHTTLHSFASALTYPCQKDWYMTHVWIPSLPETLQKQLLRYELQRHRHALQRDLQQYWTTTAASTDDDDEEAQGGFSSGDASQHHPAVITELMYEAAAVYSIMTTTHAHSQDSHSSKRRLKVSTRVYDSYTTTTLDDSFDCCAICYNDMTVGERMANLQYCNHIYHADCLKEWCRYKNACPLCQQPVGELISDDDEATRISYEE